MNNGVLKIPKYITVPVRCAALAGKTHHHLDIPLKLSVRTTYVIKVNGDRDRFFAREAGAALYRYFLSKNCMQVKGVEDWHIITSNGEPFLSVDVRLKLY